MSSFWKSLEETGKSFGGSVLAPIGAMLDGAKYVASAPFDDNDDSLGGFVAKEAGYANNMFDPIFNDKTLTGKAATWVFGKSEQLYGGATHAIATYNVMTGRAQKGVPGAWDDLFTSGEKWHQAWETSRHLSVGQSEVVGSIAPWFNDKNTLDPLNKRAYRQAHESNPLLTSMASGATDFTLRWYADPLNVVGKGYKVAKTARELRPITMADNLAGIRNLMDTQAAKSVGVKGFSYNSKAAGLQTRTESYLDYTDKLSTGEEVRLATPEFARDPDGGRQVSGLIANANKITDKGARDNAKKDILAVYFGDQDTIAKVTGMTGADGEHVAGALDEARSIRDGLKNLATGEVLRVPSSVLGRFVLDEPEHLANLDGQFANIPEVTDWLDGHIKNLEGLSSIQSLGGKATVGGGLSAGKLLPGKSQGEAALARARGETMPRQLQEKLGRVVEEGSAGSLWQKSLVHAAVWFPKKLYLDAPLGAIDALRTSTLQGMVRLDDLEGTATNIDSMLNFGHVTPAERFRLQSKLSVAKTPMERLRIVQQAEETTLQGMAAHYGQRAGEDIDADYIRDLLARANNDRSSMMSSYRGRVYGATRLNLDPSFNALQAHKVMDETRGEWGHRVDTLVADDGLPIAMPIVETQGAQVVPLMDFHRVDKVMSREFSRLSRLSRSWKQSRLELDRLSQLKAAGGDVLESALNGERAAMDWMNDAGSWLMRGWKFEMLMRLGFPIRSLSDEGARLLARFGALDTIIHPANEGARNVMHNRLPGVGRHRERAIEADKMRLRIKDIDAVMGDKVVQARRRETLEEIKRLNRRLSPFDNPDMPPVFHASSGDLSELRPRGEVQMGTGQRYGPGLYTTTDRDIANEYLSNAGATGKVHRVGAGRNAKMFDLSQHISDEDRAALADRMEAAAEEQGSDTLRVAARNLRDKRFSEHKERTYETTDADFGFGAPKVVKQRPEYTWQSLYEHVLEDESGLLNRVITDYLEETKGAHVLKQAGGQLLGGKAHDVYILLHPEKAKALGADELASLHARRDMLRENLDVDPEILERERKVLVDQLKNYKALLPAKRTIGDEGSRPLFGKEWKAALPGDIRIPAPFAGPLGQSAKNLASSQETFSNYIENRVGEIHKEITGGSWRVVQPGEDGHLDSWAWAVNKHLRKSRAAMHFIKGGSIQDFIRWVESAEGSQYARLVPHFAHDPEGWGHRLKAIVDDYIPTDAMRERVVKGEVDAKWLDREFRDQRVMPAVHGGSMEANLETGGLAQWTGKKMNDMYRAISDKPTDALIRHPFFATRYRHEADELVRSMEAHAKETGRKFGPEDAQRVATIARRKALHDVKHTLFDISAHSNAAHMLRFVSPFFAAHQEGLQRWWRIVSDDASVLNRVMQTFDAPRKMGLVVDENGNTVKASGQLPNGDEKFLLMVPRAWLTKDQVKRHALETNWAISYDSFNTLLQGGITNPGFGPIVQVPAEKMTEMWADKKSLAKFAETVNPYRTSTSRWYDPLLSATMNRFTAAVRGEKSAEYNSLYGQNVWDQTQSFILANDRQPNAQEAQRILAEAKKKTQRMAWEKFAQNLLSPFPARPESRFAAIEAGWRSIKDQGRAENRPYGWAERKFEERYGEAYSFLMDSTSNSIGGLDATSQTVAYMKQIRPLLDTIDPELASMAVSGMGKGAYDTSASNYLKNTQVGPGDPRTYYSTDSPKDALENALANNGWRDYTKMLAGLNATAHAWGFNSYLDNDQLKEEKTQMVAALAQRNPQWYSAYSTFDSSAYERQLGDMRQIANYKPFAKDTVRGDVKQLQAYLQLRDQYTAVLAAQKQAGGSDSPEALANKPLMQQFAQQVSALVESNTWFESYMFPKIEKDPYLQAVGV